MDISPHDKDVLRKLAGELAQIAALPVHAEKAELWRKLNQLESVRPMVWINEIPWCEMNVDDELTLQCSDPWAKAQEDRLRKILYSWRHMPGDMIVDDYLPCPLVYHSTGLGISEDVDVIETDEKSDVISRHFHLQIVEPEDIQKIKMPKVTYDKAATERNYQMMCDVFGGIIPIKKVGTKSTTFAPWDELIRWWGVQEAMIDMVMRPQMVNDIISHLVDAYIHELDQIESLGLLSPNNDNTRIGTGGYGYTDELPGKDFEAGHVHTKNLWGGAMAQIFSEISPEMHWEFALKHEMRWLERWGLTYYGCCEPLDIKMDIVRKIPNLRKISMSPWIDPERAAKEVRDDYVFSHKPNPAIVAENNWRAEQARAELRQVMEKARSCHVEIILKDISTVRYKPQRLWEWQQIVMEVAEEFQK